MIKYAGISEEDYERTIFKTYAGIYAGCLLYTSWGMPSGIQFDVQRGMQLALMLVLDGLMVLSFRNSMNRNQYGGR